MAAHLQALQVAKPMHNCCPPLLLTRIVKMTTSTTTLACDLIFHTVECGHKFFHNANADLLTRSVHE